MRRVGKIVGGSIVLLLLLAQLVPYGRNHSNPPVTGEPEWDSPETEALARRACFDCHSNETHWPWYASVAPMSWRVQHHVEEAREQLNFSEFDQPQHEAHEAAEKVEEGEMPLRDYLWLHSDAKLTAEETAQLVRGLETTMAGSD